MNNATCPTISYFDETRLDVINNVYFEILVMAQNALSTAVEVEGINEEIDLAVLRLTEQFGITREWITCLLDQELGAGTVGIIEADGSVRAMRDDESYTVEAFVN